MRNKVLKFLELTGAAKMCDLIIQCTLSALVRGYEANGDRMPDNCRAALALLESVLRGAVSELEDAIVALYVENYTEEEIEELIAFFCTPLGQKAVANQAVIAAQGAAIGEAWAKSHMDRIQPALERVLG